MKNTALAKLASSLEYFEKGQITALELLTEKDVVTIIKGINKGEKYWWQETRMMEDHGGNMSPRREVRLRKTTFDEFGKKNLFEPFADFVLGAVKLFPNLTLYVDHGPTFGVRYLNNQLEKPYLIKFTVGRLEEEQYQKMVEILYSKENKEKHTKAGLEEIKPLYHYDY